jgi:O-antigen/teichoic acid export membrane protein
VVLFVGTFAGNLLAYAFFLVLSRSLSAGDLGAVGSLINIGAIATVPGLGLQLVAARLMATSVPAPAVSSRSGLEHLILRLGAKIGLVLAVVLAATAPLATGLLHLDGPLPALALAVAAVPMTLTFCIQGLLQGQERFVGLSAAYLATGVTKLGAALGATAFGFGPAGVLALFAAGWLLTLAVAYAALVRGRTATGMPWRHVPADTGHPGLGREVLHAALPTSGLLVLSALDLLLARHYLSAGRSGDYTVGALFEKVAFWGPSFLATLYYPRMARAGERARAVRDALAITAGVGGVGVAVAAFAGAPLVRIVGGESFAALAPLAWVFTAVGVTLALVQVLVYADLAAAGRRVGLAVWLAALSAVGAVGLWHGDVAQVVWVMLGAVAALAVASAGLVGLDWHRERERRPA